MNLNALQSYAMLAITAGWMSNPLITVEILRHRLGEALWDELKRAHEALAAQQSLRLTVENQIAALSNRILVLDGVHDDKARGIHYILDGLIALGRDPTLVALCHELKAILFPDQLRVVSFSYAEEVGAVIDMERRVTPELLDKMATVLVGQSNLAEEYRDWVAAGKALGECVQERAALQASMGTDGTATSELHPRKVRSMWIRAVRMVLDTLDIIKLSDKAHERLMAPLHKHLAEAERRISGRGSEPDSDADGSAGNGADPAATPVATTPGPDNTTGQPAAPAPASATAGTPL